MSWNLINKMSIKLRMIFPASLTVYTYLLLFFYVQYYASVIFSALKQVVWLNHYLKDYKTLYI